MISTCGVKWGENPPFTETPILGRVRVTKMNMKHHETSKIRPSLKRKELFHSHDVSVESFGCRKETTELAIKMLAFQTGKQKKVRTDW